MWWKALLALAVSLLLQVGVNYANDYSDGIRGTDDDRVGPMRLVGSGRRRPGRSRPPRSWRSAAAGVVGLVLAATTRLVAGRGRRAVHPGRLVLHRRLAALRLPRPRRGDGLRVLRPGRRRRHDVRPDRGVPPRRAVRRRRHRRAGVRDPRRQQPARHPDRRASPASARSPWCSATSAPASSTACCVDAAVVALVGGGAHDHLVGAARRWWPRRRPSARSSTVLGDRATGPGARPGAAADRRRRAAVRRGHLRRRRRRRARHGDATAPAVTLGGMWFLILLVIVGRLRAGLHQPRHAAGQDARPVRDPDQPPAQAPAAPLSRPAPPRSLVDVLARPALLEARRRPARRAAAPGSANASRCRREQGDREHRGDHHGQQERPQQQPRLPNSSR